MKRVIITFFVLSIFIFYIYVYGGGKKNIIYCDNKNEFQILSLNEYDKDYNKYISCTIDITHSEKDAKKIKRELEKNISFFRMKKCDCKKIDEYKKIIEKINKIDKPIDLEKDEMKI